MRRLLLPLLCLASLLLGACAHYHLGTGGKLAFTSLYIAPVASETMLPQARAMLGTQLRETFLRDSRITLVSTAEEADAVLEVTLSNFERKAVVAKATDSGLARKFQLTLHASCNLQLRDGSKLLDKRLVSVNREDYVDSGQLQAEYEMLPVIAEKLSTEISHAVLDTW